MAAIRKVAVLGGSGNLGPHVVNGLLDAGFEVTVITRLESQATFTDRVTVKRIDITSKEAVESVLQGHDALVSTISPGAVGDQKTIIDAAVAAKVRRFMPSEFGVDTRRTEERSLGWILANKISVTDYLSEVVKKNPWFSWTGLAVGLFFDWGIKTQFLLGINAKDKTGTIVDSGNKPYAATHVSFIGEAVAAVLKKPEETANKYLSIFSFAITQNEVLKIFEEETGSKFQVTKLKGSDLIKAATDSVAKGDYANSVVPFVQYTFLADDSQDPVNIGKNDADLLGIKDNLGLRESIKKELSEI
ncbi:nmrA-like family domain-containing protein [Trichoderma breve]|uniref:NmrA-like family domain-containing protein n=1 Tax=Trichoderma breve TaxID=2034170 RepID=A0A9W9BDW1_9HYPO|nr:nmrA-like family domain-containing protein [Trichoderma breve]KAJ4861355.1 nmrA-like family domain-containing protein [Trichoderma breve]